MSALVDDADAMGSRLDEMAITPEDYLVMLRDAGFQDLRPMYTAAPGISICRATKGGKSFFVKLAYAEEKAALSQLESEWQILNSMQQAGIRGIPFPLSWDRYSRASGMTFNNEDGNKITFREFYCTRSRLDDIDWSLLVKRIRALCVILTGCHDAGIRHGSIRPETIVYDKSKPLDDPDAVLLGSWLFASRGEGENTFSNAQIWTSSFAYMAPECTGRIDRNADSRADLYSLGITIYEMITLKQPFAGTSALEIIHKHLSEDVAPMSNYLDVPHPLQIVVSRLLKKAPDDRYQSAYGLIRDLDQIIIALDMPGTSIDDLEIGKQDCVSNFVVTSEFIGRDAEVHELVSLYDKVKVDSRTRVATVAGYSGVGKSRLVSESMSIISRNQVFYSECKYDQYKVFTPFVTMKTILKDLLSQIFAEPTAVLAFWRSKIAAVLDKEAQVVCDLCSDLVTLLTPEYLQSLPPLVPLGAIASEERLKQGLLKLIRAFGSTEHRVIIFLDDIQWAPIAELQLILSVREQPGMLLICAFRENEIDNEHIINTLFLDNLKTDLRLVLDALTPLCTMEFICATLHRPVPDVNPLQRTEQDVRDLADMIYLKTQGNCFYIAQILTSLYRARLLHFDFAKGYWTWDIKAIQSIEMSSDVIGLVIRQVKTLSTTCQKILKVASCVGNSGFQLDILEYITSLSRSTITVELLTAMRQGLIQIGRTNYDTAAAALDVSARTPPVEGAHASVISRWPDDSSSITPTNDASGDHNVSYQFLHDRIQQAVYALVPSSERPILHLTIGLALLDRLNEHANGTMLFDICNQVNIGKSLAQADQRERLGRLNVRAAREAYANTANAFAIELLQHARDFLPKDLWAFDAELAEDFYELLENACASLARYDDALSASSTILQNTKNDVTAIRMYNRQTKALMSKGNIKEALEVAAVGLGVGKMDFADYLNGKKSQAEAIAEQGQLWTSIPLNPAKINALKSLPMLTDDFKIATADLLVTILPAVFFAYPALVQLLVLTGVKTTMTYGIGSYSTYYLAFAGLLLCEVDLLRTDFRAASAYSHVAEEILGNMMSRDHTFLDRASATLCLTGVAHCYTHDARIEGNKTLSDAIELGIRCFDGEYIAFSLGNDAVGRLYSGEALGKILPDVRKHAKTVESYKRDFGSNYALPTIQVIYNLVTGTNEQQCYSSTGQIFSDEARNLNIMRQNHMNLHQVFYWTAKLLTAILANDLDCTILALQEGRKVLQEASGVVIKTYHELLAFLAMSSLQEASAKQFQEFSDYYDSIKAHLEVWSVQNAKMFGAWKDISRVADLKKTGDLLGILEAYDQAIGKMAACGNFLFVSLINERCARWLLRQGFGRKLAIGYVQDAVQQYTEWGCAYKASSLNTEFGLEFSKAIDNSSSLKSIYLKSGNAELMPRASDDTHSTTIPGASNHAIDSPTKKVKSSTTEKILPVSHHIPSTGDDKGPQHVSQISKVTPADLDLDTVVRNSLLLNKVLHTEDIIPELLKNLLQVAGAQRATLVVDFEGTRDYKVAATTQVNDVRLFADLVLEDASDFVPTELIRLAANSKRCIIDETRHLKFRRPSNVSRRSFMKEESSMPRSFMALPVLLSDRVVAVAYLSNDQLPNLFSQNKVELLTILAAQAAVILDKGRIFTELKLTNEKLSDSKKRLEQHTTQLEATVQERTAQLQKQNAALSIEIDRRRTVEDELVKAKEAAEQATAMKSRFLAMMSHEMRTPFNSVIGFSTLLLDTELNPEQKDMAQSIVDSSTDLIAIINDILDFSKIENDKMNLSPVWFDSRSMIESTMEVMAQNAAAKGLDFAYLEDLQTAGGWIFGDNTRMRQCLLNLLSNAVKFTPEHGAVCARCTLSNIDDKHDADGNQQAILQLSISDTGIGIAHEDQDKLFQFFSQVDDSTTRKFGGTGLGLAITQKICLLFGGNLSVVSEKDKGSTFTATFQVKINRKRYPTEDTKDPFLSKKTCLILEPCPLARANLQQHLAAFGIRALVRNSLEDLQSGDRCDMSIIGESFNQPETIRILRQKGLSIARLPLVILMPFGATLPQQPSEKDLDTIDAVVSFPVRRTRLFRALQSLYPNQTGVSNFAKPTNTNMKTVTNPSESFPRKDISILLVEDNLVNIKVASQLLKRNGYVPTIAHDGIEAIAATANQHFDLILMDLSMPRMGGLDATREIRASETELHRPWICAMTANAMSGDRDRCLAAGMDQYLSKPIMLPAMTDLLNKVRDRVTGTIEGCVQVENIDLDEQRNGQEIDAAATRRRSVMLQRLGSDLQ